MSPHSYFLAILFAIASLNSLYAQPANKPNVIFILADDIGYDVPTVNGGQSFSTPNLDFMARHGMNFTHCESTPMCNPSRAMLLTGKQNFRNYSNWGYLSDTAKTIGNLMQDAGYITAFFGKLQLQHSATRMQNWGWDKYTVFEITDDTVREQRYKSPTLVGHAGRVADSITKNNYCDDLLVERISDFIDNNKSSPFFIYYSMSLIHAPFSPTPDDPQYADWDPLKGGSDTSHFPSMVKYMDKEVGKVLNKLKSVGLDTNTIVFFAGDNGTPPEIYYNANGQRVKGKKGQPREGGTHVPLIAYMPKYITPNSKNDDLIDFTDFFPTFAALGNYKYLNKYGVLDGVSFYNRLFNKNTDSKRTYIFSHYNPYPGYGLPYRWVRNKAYKLYDTTGPSKNGKYYNIETDPDELKVLHENTLTSSEENLKATFRNILDTTSSWPDGPVVNNAVVLKVTNNSVVVRATIINSGASKLIERGSTLSTSDTAFYRTRHIPDSVVALGTFSQKRSNLLAQKFYYYSLYAMNANPSNSTGYAFGTFYTLSNPPLKQPTAFAATAGACSLNVTWNKATFPTNRANKGGYLLFYSAKSIVLNQNANGNAPSNVTTDPKTRMINVQSKLPTLPATSKIIAGLSPDTLYHLVLVPYIYDGNSNSTYNYLTDGALTAAKRPVSCSSILVTAQQSEMSSASAVEITPNPSRSSFILKMDKSFANELVKVRVCDVAGRVYLNKEISDGSNYTFGSDLKPGVYIVYFSAGNKDHQFKIIKQ